MSLAVSQSLLLLNCLERFEKQSKEIQHRNELVELFCTQVIPFLTENGLLDALRKNWARQRDQMNLRVRETEAKALEEIQATADEIRLAVGVCSDEVIKAKQELIQRLISGEEKWYGTPLYRILFGELKQLLQCLLEAGHEHICVKYAKLGVRRIYVQRENPIKRWMIIRNGGQNGIPLTAKEAANAKKKGEKGLVSFYSDLELVEETFIEEFSFAPSVLDAYEAMDSVHWDRFQDPAVVWWYFETAFWYWKTTEFYFNEILRPKNGNDLGKHFQTTCEQATWREIADARDRVNDASRIPVIFTTGFFRTGLRTLANAIAVYLSQDPTTLEASPHKINDSLTHFELVLDGNELWVHVSFENQAIEKFFVQKFNEGPDLTGSRLHQFAKGLVEDPVEGTKKAKLVRKWESASKHINRLKLPMLLKQKFFAKSYSSHFDFKGARISLGSDLNEVRLILKDLRQNHLKSKERVENGKDG